MKRRTSIWLLAPLAAVLSMTVTSVAAFAHEVRPVGPYTFVVGFLNEPAYAQLQNSLDLTICTGDKCNYTVQDGLRVVANPVNNADQTLKAEVIMGSAAPLALPLEPRYANPGKYASYFIPSKVGTYIFHIFGTLNGMNIDEKFTSSPKTFSDVNQIHVYPATSAAGTQEQVQAAQNSASTATTLGIVGIVLGLLGLAAGGYALARKPNSVAAQQTIDKSSAESLRG
ncbi:MAG: hypothetical protein JO125_07225 [Chloroflexi bacterium]|nr:hypothetical protein [Ktedonobacteraceae bacterium]MBV9019871.1 hypothetical protein [Ktedonobacteraceae bacterium]MBV9707184.1 hypothetical protein [Chloroflexota bacterium]